MSATGNNSPSSRYPSPGSKTLPPTPSSTTCCGTDMFRATGVSDDSGLQSPEPTTSLEDFVTVRGSTERPTEGRSTETMSSKEITSTVPDKSNETTKSSSNPTPISNAQSRPTLSDNSQFRSIQPSTISPTAPLVSSVKTAQASGALSNERSTLSDNATRPD
ncbi:hypothetical protein V8F06_013565 [Rhypophila decipiens]